MTTKQSPIHSGYGAKTTAREVIGNRRLDGAIAVVTGGYAGIGLETTRALSAAGATVIVPARTPEKSVEDWQEERGGLPAPGHGACEHVPARKDRRDGVLLDRGGRLEPECGDAPQEVRVKVKRVERHGYVNPFGANLGPASLPRW